MKLYTKHGDQGDTSLLGGARVAKSNPRVAAYGDVDEINAAIGMVIATCNDDRIVAALRRIQSELFVLGGELANPEGRGSAPRIDDTHIAALEREIDSASDEVPPLPGFVLPGGTTTAAALHLARTICRRAERMTVALARQESVPPLVIMYLNRLSDLLFALARLANHRARLADIPWTPPKS